MRISIENLFSVDGVFRTNPISGALQFKFFYGKKSLYNGNKTKSLGFMVFLNDNRVKTITYTVDYDTSYMLEYYGFYDALLDLENQDENFYENLHISSVISKIMAKTNYKIPLDVIRDYFHFYDYLYLES